jgi:hypothetical protein
VAEWALLQIESVSRSMRTKARFSEQDGDIILPGLRGSASASMYSVDFCFSVHAAFSAGAIRRPYPALFTLRHFEFLLELVCCALSLPCHNQELPPLQAP